MALGSVHTELLTTALAMPKLLTVCGVCVHVCEFACMCGLCVYACVCA